MPSGSLIMGNQPPQPGIEPKPKDKKQKQKKTLVEALFRKFTFATLQLLALCTWEMILSDDNPSLSVRYRAVYVFFFSILLWYGNNYLIKARKPLVLSNNIRNPSMKSVEGDVKECDGSQGLDDCGLGYLWALDLAVSVPSPPRCAPQKMQGWAGARAGAVPSGSCQWVSANYTNQEQMCWGRAPHTHSTMCFL